MKQERIDYIKKTFQQKQQAEIILELCKAVENLQKPPRKPRGSGKKD